MTGLNCSTLNYEGCISTFWRLCVDFIWDYIKKKQKRELKEIV
jgi:hypothetical protein